MTLKAKILFIISLFLFIPVQGDSSLPQRKVDGIRHRSWPNYTRVVIELDGKAEYAFRLLKRDESINKPQRLYVDIKNSKLSGGAGNPISVHDGLLDYVRAGQYDKDTVRVVLDIESIKDYKVFPLSGRPFRIVIDVMGAKFKEGSDAKKPATGGSAVAPVIEPPVVVPPAGTPSAPLVVEKPAPQTATTKKISGIKTIVIDAGHGGKDPGAIGKKGLKEKDVTLKLARMLRDELKKKTNARIVLTRDSDTYIRLDERTALANSKEADLFVSLHVNASPNRKASGVETYYLGSSQDEDSVRVAARENSASKEEMQDTLQYILNDLERAGNQQESISLAATIQERLSGELKPGYGVKSNGVTGALFYVLVNCDMPSVLVEVSFISNPGDEKKLRSEKYLKSAAKGISEGVIMYANGKAVALR
ncbi:MAG: N-acetylmuramoyl-L-alanine amidase [Thermodesulfobacteriota bacterium]